VFDLSPLDNSRAPLNPILLTVSSENELKQVLLQLRWSVVRDMFDLRVSNNFIAPLLPIQLPVFVLRRVKQQVCYF
jgi:hypothetical protein